MRKYVWLSAAAMIAAAVGMYWTANYAAKHPGSFHGRCLSAAQIGLNLSCPGAGQLMPHETGGALVGASTQAVTCAHRMVERPAVQSARLPRVPKPTRKVQAKEPMEVITIEHIDPAFAKAVAEILEVPQILHPQQVSQACPVKEPDQVVYTILDPDGPVQLCNPAKNDTVPQVPQCPQCVTGEQQIRMPYCADNGESSNSCPAAHEFQVSIFQILFGPVSLTEDDVASDDDETTDLVMPYTDDENENGDAQETEMPVSSESETVPMSEGATTPPAMDPAYHHEHEGCPYLNGQYCPRYSRQYCPPAPQSEEPQTQQEQPMETEQQEQP